MEEWKKPIIIGILLAVLATAFAIATKRISIWTILIYVLAVGDIAIGLYRKKGEIWEN